MFTGSPVARIAAACCNISTPSRSLRFRGAVPPAPAAPRWSARRHRWPGRPARPGRPAPALPFHPADVVRRLADRPVAAPTQLTGLGPELSGEPTAAPGFISHIEAERGQRPRGGTAGHRRRARPHRAPRAVDPRGGGKPALPLRPGQPQCISQQPHGISAQRPHPAGLKVMHCALAQPGACRSKDVRSTGPPRWQPGPGATSRRPPAGLLASPVIVPASPVRPPPVTAAPRPKSA